MHYYYKYDDFYNRVYGHGIPYWADGPDGCRGIIAHTIDHIVKACPRPSGRALIETGCGEGLCATAIAGLDIAYTGIDCSARAIAKAQARARGSSGKIRFGVADVLVLESDLLHDHYDIVLDMACFHMFILEDDRRQYLANIRALMNQNAVLLMLGELCNEDAYQGTISSLGEYQRIFQQNLEKPTPWDAWDGNKYVQLQLPTLATRPKSKADYIGELEAAGFKVNTVHKHPQGNKLDFALKLR